MSEETNFKKFILLWIGDLISQIGAGITSFGLSVYIFQQTKNAGDIALITLLGFLPGLFLTIPSGFLADKYDRRILMIIGDGCSGLGVLFILICILNNGANLTQICMGVFISSVFSSLLEPSYRATINDLLTEEEFSKASGLVSLAGSAKYLFSPLIASILLTISDIKLLLIIDISTFFLTTICILIVRKNIQNKDKIKEILFINSIKTCFNFICNKKGILILTILSGFITLFMGTFQVLAVPIVLSITNSKVLGITETICASGMLVSGIILGTKGIKKNFIKILSISLILSGIFILGFSIFTNIIIMCIFGFLFFATLPFANNCLDFLLRTNIPNEFQGRIWGVIGFISQIGYVISYSISGNLADYLKTLTHLDIGRSSAIIIGFSGIFLILISIFIPNIKKIQDLEK